MPLQVISCYSYRTSIDSPWTDAQHSVNQFVDAIKARPIKGYGHLLVNAPPRRRLEAANARDATVWFGEMASQILDTEGLARAVLVPVPNSSCVTTTASSRTSALADAAAQLSQLHHVDDFIRWDQIMPSASGQNGPRHPAVLYPHLRRRGQPIVRPEQAYVLIDDVLTSGGHLRACAAFLRAFGVEPALAICAARSDSIAQADPFERRTDELEDFEP